MPEVGPHIHGVALIFIIIPKKLFPEFRPVNERIITARFQDKHISINQVRRKWPHWQKLVEAEIPHLMLSTHEVLRERRRREKI